MRIKAFCFSLVAIATALCLQGTASGAIQASESFDSTNVWRFLPFPTAGYTNTATSVTGWVINNGAIVTNNTTQGGDTNTTPSYPYVLRLSGPASNNASLASPWLSNGIGSVVYYARTFDSTRSNRVVVETSSGDGNWTTRGVTNYIPSNSWVLCTNTVLINSGQYFRIRKIFTNNVAQASVFFDSVSVTIPPAIIAVTNLSLTPAIPVENDSLSVDAALSVNGQPEALAGTNYWKISSSTNWIAIPMATNSVNVFTTITNIPSQPVFTPIDYYVQISQVSDGVSYTTNTATRTVVIRPRSFFTNMVVTGQINTVLTLSSNYQWQGVTYVSNGVSAFRFQGTSNGNTTVWGDSNQTISNVQAYGNGEIGATNILVAVTNAGMHLFTFNETDLTYSARPCVYDNFDAWANQGFATTTNVWILSGGAISNDAAGTYSNRYVTLNGQQGGSTNASLTSPLLTNGVGNISFWYRKAGTNGALAGLLAVQVAPTPSSTNWVTIATLSNLLSTSYSFVNIAWSDLNNQAVRLLNNPNGGNSQVSLDEVIIASPGAAVYAANLTNSPAAPGAMDTVKIAIDLSPNAWATLTNVTVWYRGASNLLYESLPLTLSNANHYVTPTGIPPTLGTVQYAIQYSYAGFLGMSPLFFPSGGTNQPYSYSTTNTILSYRTESFDSSARWGSFPVPTTGYTNTVTNTIGWVICNSSILTNDATAPSPSGVCRVGTNTTASIATIVSPLLSNGVGSAVFYSRLSTSAKTNLIIFETSSGDGFWNPSTQTNVITSSSSWTSFTNTILIGSNCFARIRKLNAYGSNSTFDVLFDSIYFTPYPTSITITNIYLDPGYPAAGQTGNVACDILSATAQYPAYSITPTLYWSLAGGQTSSIAMAQASSNKYVTSYPFSLAGVTRGHTVTYWLTCAFSGFSAVPADNLSPRTSPTNTFVTQAFQGEYSSVSGVVSGMEVAATGRLMSNATWRSILNISSNILGAFSISGTGHSSGNGYAITNHVIGNSNNWQTAIPVADIGGIDEPPISLYLTNGQYVLQYDETSRTYMLQRCVWQDFDKAGDSGLFKQTTLSSSSVGLEQTFDSFPANQTRTRSENFEGYPWTNYLNTYINGDGANFCLAYSGRVSSVIGQGYVVQLLSNAVSASDSFIAQASHWGQFPLRGVGRVTYTYAAVSTNTQARLSVFLASTNQYAEAPDGSTSYMDYKIYDNWRYNTPVAQLSNITNTAFISITNDINTNACSDVILSQVAGTQSLQFASVGVSEWYSEQQQTNSDGWIVSGYWIETNLAAEAGNVCRLDVTRVSSPSSQFIRTPRIDGGIKDIEFMYSGAASTTVNAPTNINVSFSVDLSTTGETWTNTLDTITTNFSNTAGTNFYVYYRSLQTPQNSLYVRIRNGTAKPGALLIDRIRIPSFAATNDWYVNNVAIEYHEQTSPPWPRQWHRGVAYLNNSRTTNSMATGNEFPDTNSFPQVRTPELTGVGEVSFRYRNWTTNGSVPPAKLVIQSAQTLTGSESDWDYTLATLTNIVNTNDYLYYSVSTYAPASRYVRIYNDDRYTSTPGRVCIDDLLVTAPLAASLALSNLTTSPTFPLSSNRVDILIDVVQQFLTPTNITLTALYGTATTYADLLTTPRTSIPMECVYTNTSVPGKLYRYRTVEPIPSNTVDTFVSYAAQASFEGYHAAATSPISNHTFASSPVWLAPLDSINGTNLAYYVVLSSPTGTVWINELNVRDLSTGKPKYIEVCGPAGVSLHNWSMVIYDSAAATTAVYVVTNLFIFPSATNGFGFWTIGDLNTTNRDMTTTNTLPSTGGIRLVRKTGMYADGISYGSSALNALTNIGLNYIGNDSSTRTAPLSLTGIGSNASSFSWTNWSTFTFTPGVVNISQTFPQTVIADYYALTTTIVRLVIDTNVWLECTGTNGWSPSPYFSTNLLSSNNWQAITSYQSTYPSLSTNSTYTLNFTRPTNGIFFFKITSTNMP